MNRYSLVFALLIASSFAVHPRQAGVGSESTGEGSSLTSSRTNGSSPNHRKPANQGAQDSDDNQPKLHSAADDAIAAIQAFLAKSGSEATAPQHIQILFVTMPNPVETHLAAAFDHNIEALQDGLKDAGYLFDSSLIPWEVKRERESFDDDQKEKNAGEDADRTPGVLLFRNHNSADSYANGIAVLLLSEKPTEGIEFEQVKTAWDILVDLCIRVRKPAPIFGESLRTGHNKSAVCPTVPAGSQPIRILAPTFSGSLDSLVPVVDFLHRQDELAPVIIRSPSVTGGTSAMTVIDKIAQDVEPAKVDFGSAFHDYADSVDVAKNALKTMGIAPEEIAMLSEEESLFGGLYREANDTDSTGGQMWSIGFPRDISSLRASYAQQGVFDYSTSTEPWKRFLNLKNDAQSEGDSVHSFGGANTTAAQEAILFGISEFLKQHSIRAAIISATNEDDRLFLTQFLHANNSGVRVAVIGSTRLFLRGSMAQFRGDLFVNNFPMFPLLHDWTAAEGDRREHIFADDESYGTYFSALDLMAEPRAGCKSVVNPCADKDRTVFEWFPEYSEPQLAGAVPSAQQPPLYLTAVGNDAAWPVAESAGKILQMALSKDGKTPFAFQMPFALFAHDLSARTEAGPAPTGTGPPPAQGRPAPIQLRIDIHWRTLLLFLFVVVASYCACIRYANPISRDQFASFQPTDSLGFWMLKIAIPSTAAGAAFSVMAWAVAIPAAASAPMSVAASLQQTSVAWWLAAICALLAPAAVAGTAVLKWKKTLGQRMTRKVWSGVIAVAVAEGGLSLCLLLGRLEAAPDLSAILNTYREMHWESGLSLLPTAMLFLLAIAVWSGQAGNGAAAIKGAPPLPNFPLNKRISHERKEMICAIGRPLPGLRTAKWLWSIWGIVAVAFLLAHFFFAPFVRLTTLESFWISFLIRGAGAVLVLLILLDTMQFLWLWDELHGLLLALDRERFKRSFVAIREFDWRSLWSFTGVSLQSRRALNTQLIHCLDDLVNKHGFTALQAHSDELTRLREKYNDLNLGKISPRAYKDDFQASFTALSKVSDALAVWVSDRKNDGTPEDIPPRVEAIQRAIESKSAADCYADEEEELARLPEKNQAVERFLCLMYIGFIQTVVARLHTQLVSIASVYSLVSLGVAIYPFVPLSSPVALGMALLILIAWAFFRVFSQMDTDPILSRIVNGDDRKLQGNFYFKFAEAMALPLLTAGSALLPGGVGRLLELAQTFLNQGH